MSSAAAHDIETDVVVVGSGAAGFSAALAALGCGSRVVLLEKDATLGGTTIKSSIWAWYPNHRRLREAGHHDDKAAVMRYMARLSRPEAYDPADPTLGLPRWRHDLLDAFYDAAADAAEAIEQAGVWATDLPDFPDYYSYLPENEVPCGRTLRPASADGEPATAEDWIANAATATVERSGEILTGHRVEDVLLDDDGRVTGVVATHEGRTLTVRAPRGVIFASGGFGQSPELRADHLAAPILGSCAAQGNTGDFLGIAHRLGAPLRNMAHPWMTLMVLEKAIENAPDCKSLFHPAGDSMLWVNRYGDRTLNEKAPYNETAQMLQRWNARDAEYPDLYQVMVWDQACQDIHASDRPANPIRPAGEPATHVLAADTLDELAAAVEDRFAALAGATGGVQLGTGFAERLRRSVARFNEQAATGTDCDFGRGDTPIERGFNEMMSGPGRSDVNPLMYPLADAGPYYATIIVPGALDTKGGPVIDRHARVLRADGTPIPGLYGAGNCVASPGGKSYWAAGATIGPAVTFGYLAGRHAAWSSTEAGSLSGAGAAHA